VEKPKVGSAIFEAQTAAGNAAGLLGAFDIVHEHLLIIDFPQPYGL